MTRRLTRLLAAVLPTALAVIGCAAEQVDDSDDSEEIGETSQALSAERLACEGYNATDADKLAKAGLKRSKYRSQSKCYAYVKRHLAAAGRSIPEQLYSTTYGASAYQFANWARNNPNDLARLGFKEVKLGSDERPPKGSVIVWARGQCGFSARHGHIEVVVDDGGRACSDFCGTIRSGCGTPSVFIPIGPGSAPSNTDCASASNGVAPPSPPIPTPRPTDAGPQQDSCVGKADGWYCSELAAYSGYQCEGQQIAIGYQCPSGACAYSGPNRAAIVQDGVPACN